MVFFPEVHIWNAYKFLQIGTDSSFHIWYKFMNKQMKSGNVAV